MIETPFDKLNDVVNEIHVLQEGFDILEKLYVFYNLSKWDLEINGKQVDNKLKLRIRNYFHFDDSE
jgi:hypothetical protein